MRAFVRTGERPCVRVFVRAIVRSQSLGRFLFCHPHFRLDDAKFLWDFVFKVTVICDEWRRGLGKEVAIFCKFPTEEIMCVQKSSVLFMYFSPEFCIFDMNLNSLDRLKLWGNSCSLAMTPLFLFMWPGCIDTHCTVCCARMSYHGSCCPSRTICCHFICRQH